MGIITDNLAIIIIVLVSIIVLVASLNAVLRLYINVPTDKAAIITGRGEKKAVIGHGHLRIPIIEKVAWISLETIPIDLEVYDVFSSNNVPVSVKASAQVRIPSDPAMALTAAERFQSTEDSKRYAIVKNTLEGIMRSIIVTMTIEELNSDRKKFMEEVQSQAVTQLAEIGHKVEQVTIQTIGDKNGYLDALGAPRIAEVKASAQIAQADAERRSTELVAAAKQAGEKAKAESEAAIALAQRDRDIQITQARAQIDAEKARTEQAGPLAQAEAQKAVGVAKMAAQAASEQAGLEVEQRRTERARQAAEADTIVPAEAQKLASIATAEGARQARILTAQGEAEATKTEGSANAASRTAIAEAQKAELVATADGKKASLLADADGRKASLLADAEGELRLLLARAEGQAKLAEALNTFTGPAAQLQMLPEILRAMVEQTAAAAKPVGDIDRITVISSGNGDVTGGIQNIVPETLTKTIAMLESQGIDIAGILANFGKNAVAKPVE